MAGIRLEVNPRQALLIVGHFSKHAVASIAQLAFKHTGVLTLCVVAGPLVVRARKPIAMVALQCTAGSWKEYQEGQKM